MEHVKTILKSGIRNINLVAPDVRCSSRAKERILSCGFKGLTLMEGCEWKSDSGWCNMVCYSSKDEELITSHLLLMKIIGPHCLDSRCAHDFYHELRTGDVLNISSKSLMRRLGIGSFYKTRSIIGSFATSGLFIPVEGEKGRRGLIPYYYNGSDVRILIIRHLLSLGYEVTFSPTLIKARLGSSFLAAGEDIDSLNSIQEQVSKILISPQSPVINFSGIRSYTLTSFLSCNAFS